MKKGAILCIKCTKFHTPIDAYVPWGTDTSAPRDFGTGAEMSEQIGTISEFEKAVISHTSLAFLQSVEMHISKKY